MFFVIRIIPMAKGSKSCQLYLRVPAVLELNIKTDNFREKYTIYVKTGSRLGKNIPS